MDVQPDCEYLQIRWLGHQFGSEALEETLWTWYTGALFDYLLDSKLYSPAFGKSLLVLLTSYLHAE